MDIIKVQKLSKVFYKHNKSFINILSDINFSVNKGDCFVIIGPNGSGKTTLLRILGLLEPPSKGKVIYNGIDLGNISRKKKVAYRRKFSFVRQKPVVRNASVFDNIAYGLRTRGMKWEEYIDKVNDIIEFIGLKGFEKKNARSLSGGEMQRVAIAMNFVISPEIYLLDEVSANLDPVNVKLLEDFIIKIKQDKEKTIIMSTHDPFEAIKFGDRIAVLNNGQIIQIGTPNEIFTAPKDEFTALFVGYENILSGMAEMDINSGLTIIKINNLTIITSEQVEGEVKVCIRPESIGISKNPPSNASYRNTFKGNIEDIRDLGNICHIIIKCQSERFLVTITKLSLNNLELTKNTEVFINFKATDVKIL